MQSKTSFPNRTITLVILAVLTLPDIVGLVFAAVLAWASPLILLSGPADAGACFAFLTLCTCPFVFAVAIAGGWLCFFLKRYRLALILASIPLLEGLVFLIASLVFEGAY